MVRGQGSLEYVMNYSWVILLVLIVGIVLSESGVLSSGTSAGTFSGFAKVRPQLSGVSLDKNGNFQGVFTNGLGQLITVTTVGMSVSNGGECSNYAVSPASVPSGSNFIVTADTCPVDNLGDPYTLTITIPYTIVLGAVTVDKTDFGIIYGTTMDAVPTTTSTTTSTTTTSTSTTTTTAPACGGYEALGYCWYEGAVGQSCDTVCAAHGGCVAENWNDDASCSVCTHFHPSPAHCYAGSVYNYPSYHGSGDNVCYKRNAGIAQRCWDAPGGNSRFCVCAS